MYSQRVKPGLCRKVQMTRNETINLVTRAVRKWQHDAFEAGVYSRVRVRILDEEPHAVVVR